MTWRELPVGMKLVIVWLALGLSVYLVRDPESSLSFFGVSVQYPWSTVVETFFAFVNIYVMIQVYRQCAWKIILILYGLSVGSALTSVFILLSQADTRSGLHAIPLGAKMTVFFPSAIGLVVGIVIWVYILRNKDLFVGQ